MLSNSIQSLSHQVIATHLRLFMLKHWYRCIAHKHQHVETSSDQTDLGYRESRDIGGTEEC